MSIEAGVQDVAMVWLGGDPLYGEQSVMSALGKSCETIDVCGNTRSICIEDEFGQTYQDLENDVPGAYPAFFCSTPQDEPSCIPYRPGEFTGISSTDGDGDGLIDYGDFLSFGLGDDRRSRGRQHRRRGGRPRAGGGI